MVWKAPGKSAVCSVAEWSIEKNKSTASLWLVEVAGGNLRRLTYAQLISGVYRVVVHDLLTHTDLFATNDCAAHGAHAAGLAFALLGLHLGDDDVRAEPLRAVRDAPAAVPVAGHDDVFAAQEDVGGPQEHRDRDDVLLEIDDGIVGLFDQQQEQRVRGERELRRFRRRVHADERNPAAGDAGGGQGAPGH